MMKKDDSAMMQQSDSSMMKKDLAAGFYDLSALGPQVDYFTTEAEAAKMAEGSKVVYFFAATWCPNCRETYKNLSANYAMIPKNVKVLFVNYDKASDLKKKYGVTYQHTFVLIDSMGRAVKTWSGSQTVADIVKNATGM